MPRPQNKADLLAAAEENYEKLMSAADGMSEKELNTPFDFSADASKKEAHWGRDKNLRDVFIHLYEWHRLLLEWLDANRKGGNVPFLPPPYTWKTYGDMNVEFWKKHQSTPLGKARELLASSHKAVMAAAEAFPDEDMFVKGKFKWAGTSAVGSYFVSVTSSHYDWALKKLKAHKKNVG